MIRMSSVWDRATEFIGDNLGAIMPFALVIVAAVAVQDVTNQAIQGVAPVARLGGSGILLVVALVSMFARFSIMALAIDDRRGRGEAAALVGGRFLAIIGVLILVGLAVIVLMVPIFLALLTSGLPMQRLAHVDAQAMESLSPGLKLFLALYMLALLVVALWLAARLALLMPVVLVERLSLGAFARSFALTRGYALRILGVLLLIGIVGMVAAMAARTVAGSVLRLALGEAGPLGAGPVLTALIVAAVATLFTVIGDAFAGKLYLAARAAEADPADA